eukprot:gene12229-14322_t
MDPKEIVNKIFTPEFVTYIIQTTNIKIAKRNALAEATRQYLENNSAHPRPSRPPRRRVVAPMTKRDWDKFMVASILLGIVHFPQVKQYWDKQDTTSIVGLEKMIATVRRERFRFYQIKQNLYIDIGYPQRYFSGIFKSLWNTGTHIAIDETIIAFKGRYRFRQFIRGKPNSTGLKLYTIADMYNKYKGAVDIADSHFNRYLSDHKHKKWTNAGFGAFIQIALSNAWLIYRHHHPKVSLLDFLLAYVRSFDFTNATGTDTNFVPPSLLALVKYGQETY